MNITSMTNLDHVAEDFQHLLHIKYEDCFPVITFTKWNNDPG